MDASIMLCGALAIELALGEPPRVIHPVVWMGKVTSVWEKAGIGQRPVTQFVFGAGMTILTVALFTIPAYFVLFHLKGISYVAYVTLGAVLLKLTFSVRELRRAALGVKRLLVEERLDEVRHELRSLVSRDTRGLPKPLLVSATVESVAENLSDSFVAPLFYFLLLGVPGAIAYRVINTLDAMIGYHGNHEYLGKFASRLDDVVNFVPARLTALLLVLAAFLSRRDARSSWQVMLSDHAKTESPNAGWPMAAVAGALNVRLEKSGHYELGRASVPLVPQVIDANLKLIEIAALVWVIVCFTVGVISIAVTA